MKKFFIKMAESLETVHTHVVLFDTFLDVLNIEKKRERTRKNRPK